MNFAIIVLYELLDEGAILVKDFIAHVRDVMQNGLILNLENQRTQRFMYAHHTKFEHSCLILCLFLPN